MKIDDICTEHGTDLVSLDPLRKQGWEKWQGTSGPPVPVIVDSNAWRVLVRAVISTANPKQSPRVFRLFMRRRSPRHVVEVTEIKRVWQNMRGTIRWQEGEYPLRSGTLRKGGNAFIRGDTNFVLSDAWWMGRERTDLRILLAQGGDRIHVAARRSRGGASGLTGKHETDGEVWPVRLLLDDSNQIREAAHLF